MEMRDGCYLQVSGTLMLGFYCPSGGPIYLLGSIMKVFYKRVQDGYYNHVGWDVEDTGNFGL